jgi:hypothetical protein
MAAGSLPKTWRSPQDVVIDRLRPASEGGIITLSANGKKIGEGRVEMTTPFKYALAEGQDIGEDSGSPIDSRQTPPFNFTSQVWSSDRGIEIACDSRHSTFWSKIRTAGGDGNRGGRSWPQTSFRSLWMSLRRTSLPG